VSVCVSVCVSAYAQQLPGELVTSTGPQRCGILGVQVHCCACMSSASEFTHLWNAGGGRFVCGVHEVLAVHANRAVASTTR
jgi:hypothetical protein